MRRQSNVVNNQKNIKLLAAVLLFLGAVAAFLGTPPTTSAQSPISATVDRARLSLDEQVTLTVTVTGDFLNIPNPDLSQLQDFVVVSSSTSTQVSIVNGQMSSQKIFIYRLQPLTEGTLTIGPLSLTVGGQLYQTDPIEVEVVAGGSPVVPPGSPPPDADAPDTLSGQDYFVEAEVSNPNPYLGQQIISIFRIYQAVQFPPGQPDYQPPDFTDFWSSEILSQPHYNTQAAGRSYLVIEIQTALFPATLGTLTIRPGNLVIPGGFLNPDIRLETNPVTVKVRPLPENAPNNFSGAVGQYQINASLNAQETKVNEPVTLVVSIEGSGNVETLTEPTLPELPGWRLFESQASTTVETGGGKMSGTRSFERLIVPGQPGEQQIPPISFSYFDPQSEGYKTVSTQPIPITVLPDDSAQIPLNIPDEAGDGQPGSMILTDIRHIKPVPTSLNSAFDFSFVGWTLYGVGWVVPALAVAGLYVWQRHKRRLAEDTAYARDLRAQSTALKILADATQANVDRPAAPAGRALLGYISDKLNTPTAGLTNQGLIDLLREAGLPANLLEQTETLLHKIDIGRFAPTTEGAGQSLIAETRQLIKALEKSMGKRR